MVYRDPFRGPVTLSAIILALLTLACAPSDRDPALLAADRPLHLEDHLEAARIEGSALPTDVPDPIEWRFDRPRPEWKALRHYKPSLPPPRLEYTGEALRVSLDERHRDPRKKRLHGDIYVDVPELVRADWSHVRVRARASEEITDVMIGFNLEPPDEVPEDQGPSRFFGDNAVAVNDGSVQSYALRADWDWEYAAGKWKGPWRQLILGINAGAPSSLEILSVELVPKSAVYADLPFGVRSVEKGCRQTAASTSGWGCCVAIARCASGSTCSTGTAKSRCSSTRPGPTRTRGPSDRSISPPTPGGPLPWPSRWTPITPATWPSGLRLR
jgi:hypothetical protein